MTTPSKINPHILKWMVMVETGAIRACEEQHLLMAHIRYCFATEDIYTDDKQLENYLGLTKYFPFKQIFEWQEFVLALHLTTYRRDGMPRWPDLFCLIGRGAGKDGTIALEASCLTSPYNPIPRYDVDICANNEEQAVRPLKDVIDAFETPKFVKKLRRFFYWTKELVVSLKNKSTIKGRTNNPKGRDGMRSGIVVFNEIHQYENYANIDVFTTGLGKVPHPRRAYFTTQGTVREGPLDDLVERANGILRNQEHDNGLLPFICKLDDKEEVHDPENWVKANPSLPHLPSLMEETKKEYIEWKKNPASLPAFMTKRMNIPEDFNEIAVVDYNILLLTKTPLPDLSGWNSVCGVDYMKTTDFASVNLRFKLDNQRFDISHSWICSQSKDIPRIKAPWKQWAQDKLLTVVDDAEIHPDIIAEYIFEQGQQYNIIKLALDNYRYALLSNSLKSIGFDKKERKNVYLVRPSDIMVIVPVIDHCFANQYLSWGDNPLLRWATNNTKLIRAGKKIGSDTGNFVYGKIEAKSRKTDPFMAMVASAVIEHELDSGSSVIADLPVIL